MATELVLESELGAVGGVELDCVVTRDSYSAAVGGEGVVCDWVVEEVVNLWRSHDDGLAGVFSQLPVCWGCCSC